MNRPVLITLIFVFSLISSELHSYRPEHLAQLNATGACTFCDLTNLKDTDLNLAPGVLVTDLSCSDLRWAKLSNLEWQRVKLIYADLRHAKFHVVDLKQANLDNARLMDTKMYRVNLKNAHLDNTNFTDAMFHKVNLSDLRSEVGTIWPHDLNRATPTRAFTTEEFEADSFSDSDADSDGVDE